uniref:Uncharacterized protein n=1 Tax=Glossina austeni TaxID=7395 RepID=A0A1A9V2F3_GLOAU
MIDNFGRSQCQIAVLCSISNLTESLVGGFFTFLIMNSNYEGIIARCVHGEEESHILALTANRITLPKCIQDIAYGQHPLPPRIIQFEYCITDLLLCYAKVTTAPLAMVVPETSYSSSEGEDDYYDANDDPFTSLGSSPVTW